MTTSNLLEAIDQIIIDQMRLSFISKSKMERSNAACTAYQLKEVRKLYMADREQLAREIKAYFGNDDRDGKRCDCNSCLDRDAVLAIVTEGKEKGEDNKK